MDYTAQLESPDSYHLWVGMSMIAACLGRKTWLDMGLFKVFTNMYIVLVGPPGRCRKSVAVNTGIDLVLDMPDEVRVSADSITREALIQLINTCKSDKTLIDYGEGEVPYVHSSLTVISKELSVFLGTGNHDLLSLLTDLYDCPKVWVYKTKGQGTDSLQGPWLNMLGASTPDWLVGSVPAEAIGGGFTSRVLFIVEDKVRHKKAKPKMTEHELTLRSKLQHDLEQMCLAKGEFILTQEADEHYEEWYNNDNTKIDDARFWGYAERKHIHMLKVAMILAVSEGMDNIIEDKHVTRALRLLDDIEPSMIEAFGAAGRNPYAADMDEIIQNIKRSGKIEHMQLRRSLLMNVSKGNFAEAINTLLALNMVKATVDKETKQTWYTYEG